MFKVFYLFFCYFVLVESLPGAYLHPGLKDKQTLIARGAPKPKAAPKGGAPKGSPKGGAPKGGKAGKPKGGKGGSCKSSSAPPKGAGVSKNHNPAKVAEAKKNGQKLPWDKLRCVCTVSEQSIPVLGNMGWHFDLRVTGFGDNGKNCGGGILDNIHGECHTSIDVRQWFCEKKGEDRHISWDSSKTFWHQGVEMALWRASNEQMGGCKCDYNYAKSTVESVFSGLAMAIPIPAAQVVKTAATVIATGVKAGITAAKAGASAAVKAIGSAGAKKAVTKAATNVAKKTGKDAVKNQQKQESC
jgi:hypothetical protein